MKRVQATVSSLTLFILVFLLHRFLRLGLDVLSVQLVLFLLPRLLRVLGCGGGGGTGLLRLDLSGSRLGSQLLLLRLK